MKVSRKWLENYMDLSDLSMEELAEKITNAGLEVEGITPLSSGSNLVIGQVLEVSDHPDSDHLHCTKVDIGNNVLEIVCGAPNVAPGQKVIVAKPGAVLPGGVIKSGKIRGQKSEGMICALFELGVDKHLLSQEQVDGIEVLAPDAPIGHEDPLGYLGYDDVILDISLTPNRADCLAINNLALEIGAILDREVRLPQAEEVESELETSLKIGSETKGCPIFLGKVIGSVTLKESPEWMKQQLRAAGMHSINNVVDISNIVMLETGQPLHFYDFDAIHDQEITVKDGLTTEYTALDEVTYKLLPEDLVITNQDRPIGIAGIMGGDDSKILDTTTSLIIECALFDSVRIRNTARRLGLATEASIRYQKGVEPLAGLKAMKRAVWLLEKYADAKGIEKTVIFGNPRDAGKEISFTFDQINHRLGTDFSSQEIMDVLQRLHLQPEIRDGIVSVRVPSYRMDLEGMADISEEIIRMLGYDRLQGTLPYMEMTEGKLNPMQKLIRYTRSYFTQAGLQECLTYTLVSGEKEDQVSVARQAAELNPPLSEERRYIRTGVLPSLLESALYNINRKNKQVNLFEISEISTRDEFFTELAVVLCDPLQQTRSAGFSIPNDFYTIKGLLEEYLEHLGFDARRIHWVENRKDTEHFHPYQSAQIEIDRKLVGMAGMIHPSYAAKLGLSSCSMAWLDLSLLESLKKAKIKSPSLSKYPEVLRDLAVLVDADLPVEKLMASLESKAKINRKPVLKGIEVFDVYTGKGIEPGKKSVALALTFQSDQMTLSDEQVNEMMTGMIQELENRFDARLRS